MPDESDGLVHLVTAECPTEITIDQALITARDEIVEKGEAVQVDTDSRYEQAGQLLRDVTKLLKEIDKHRKALTKPFRNATKEINQSVQGFNDSLEQVKARIKHQMADYETYQRRLAEAKRKQQEEIENQKAREAAEARAAEAEIFGEPTTPEYQPAAVEPTEQAPRSHATTTVEKLEFEIVSDDDIPRRFMRVDERKIRADLQARKDELKRKIAHNNGQPITENGIRYTKTLQIRSR